jgi:hypothetical protein
MKRDDNPAPALHRQPMGVNGLPDDYIDDSAKDDAVGGSRDEREPQPISAEGLPPAAKSESDDSRADSVIKPAHDPEP